MLLLLFSPLSYFSSSPIQAFSKNPDVEVFNFDFSFVLQSLRFLNSSEEKKLISTNNQASQKNIIIRPKCILL